MEKKSVESLLRGQNAFTAENNFDEVAAMWTKVANLSAYASTVFANNFVRYRIFRINVIYWKNITRNIVLLKIVHAAISQQLVIAV